MQTQLAKQGKSISIDLSKLSQEKQEEISSQELQLKDDSHNFTVSVRIKPKDPQEENVKIIINKNCKEMSIETTKQIRNNYVGGKCKTFKMDAVYQQKVTNEVIFNRTVKEKLEILKANRNMALMAYGATNSGKTYTILGSGKSHQNKQEGLAHLSYRYLMEDLFKGNFKFYFSYLEIYNENVQDLLCDQQRRHNLNVFEDHSGKINIPQLTKIEVSHYSELFKLIEIGSIARAESSNNINKVSSRSHAILQLEIFSTQDGDSEVTQSPIDVNFMIIDLAGSEKSTPYFQQSQQITLKEGSNINRSLLALGNCIKNLANGDSHIPYRNSKLTRLLKQNLSGSCHNIMIACISHSCLQFQQSISTLQYASKACRIAVTKDMVRGRDRGKFVTIPCEHCKMSIDFSYLCKAFKQHAFQVVDQLIQPNAEVGTFKHNFMPKQNNELQGYMVRIQKLCEEPEKLQHLNKLLENIEKSDPKVEIHIQETEDSQRQSQKDEVSHKSLLRLKSRLNLNVDRGRQKLAIKDNSTENKRGERHSRSRSQKSVKLRLKQGRSSKTKHNSDKQPDTSYIKIEEPPKSLNVSSINSRKQERVKYNQNQDNFIQPFLPELSFDISEFYHPHEKLFKGRIQKDFQGIQFARQKRHSESMKHDFGKENSEILTNLIETNPNGSKTSRDILTEALQPMSSNASFGSKALKRMKQDVIPNTKQNSIRSRKEGSQQTNQGEPKSKIRLLARVR